jgi:hypothetical protein
MQNKDSFLFFQGSTGKFARLRMGELKYGGTVGLIEYSVTSLKFQDMTDFEGVEGLEVRTFVKKGACQKQLLFDI